MKKRAVLLGILLAVVTATPLLSPHNPKPIPTPKHATMEQKKANKMLAIKLARYGWGWKGKEWVCADTLFTKESRYDNLADNKKSSAFGIGQMLNETSKDPEIQLLRTFRYIQKRYSTPCRALRHHHRLGWY